MHRRDVALAASSVLLGGFLGAVLTVGAAGSAFAPAQWFWIAFWLLPLTFLASLVYLGVDAYRERRFHDSEALTLSFDSADGRCLETQQAKAPKVARERNVISTASESELFHSWKPVDNPLEGHIRIVRLKVTNQRPKWVRNAVVELVEMRDSDNTPNPNATGRLRWIHDDDPPFFVSTHGAQCGPDSESHMYVDLLFKVVGRRDFRVQFANDGLRKQNVKDGTYKMLLASSSRDEETGRRAPRRYQAFTISVPGDGRVTVVPHEPSELGFKP